jgi:hypothetical protein
LGWNNGWGKSTMQSIDRLKGPAGQEWGMGFAWGSYFDHHLGTGGCRGECGRRLVAVKLATELMAWS